MKHNKHSIAQSFSRSAARYDQAATIQQWAGQQLLTIMQDQGLLVNKAKIQTIADVGCGTGYLAGQLVDTYQPDSYIGIDLAPGMLALAQAQQALGCHTQWLCDDAENLSLANASVDMIFANFSLQWCDQLHQLMEHFYRVLTPGGYACFTSLGPTTLTELRQAWQQVDQHHHVNDFDDHHQWRSAIESMPFNVLHHHHTVQPVYFDTALHALRSLKDIGANIVSGDQRQGLTGKQHFEQFTQAYETFRTPNGLPVSYAIDSWVIQK